MLSQEQVCPACGQENACRVANGSPYTGPCWCEVFTISAELQRQLAVAFPTRVCLCGDCLVRFSESSILHAESPRPEPVVGEDYYFDEFGRTVFTAAYLLKRGHCCDSGCRHCPYPPQARL